MKALKTQKNSHQIYSALVILLLGLSAGCASDDLRPLTAAYTTSDGINKIIADGSTSFSYNHGMTYNWQIEPSIPLINPNSSLLWVDIPANSTGGTYQLSLTVGDGQQNRTLTRSLFLPQANAARLNGLGHQIVDEKSNNVPYEWYIDQMTTGTYAGENCGPTSVTMSIKWANQNFTETPEDARNKYRSTGGWWYTNDMTNYLNDNNILNYVVSYADSNSPISELNQGNIVILCLDMFYVEPEKEDDFHFNKFYPAGTIGWGHFIVLKGYKHVSTDNVQSLFFEAYDPNSWGDTYDGTVLKGKDRYYTDADLFKATQKWWPFMIVVSKDRTSSGRVGIDITNLPVQSGR